MDNYLIYSQSFSSRILLGTAAYPNTQTMQNAIQAASPAMITVSLRRQSAHAKSDGNGFWDLLRTLNIPILPNTAGCQSVQEAVATAQMARELFATPWIKLELIGDDDTLQPDIFQLVQAANILIKEGFYVLPYCTEDLIACRRLLDVGCQALMPWAAPIGTGLGAVHGYALRVLRERLPETPLIIDAGLGLPSHAAQVMEWGFDAVLLNSAVSRSADPILMAKAFAQATQAGRDAHLAQPMIARTRAQASTTTIGQPFWHSADY